MGHRGHVSNSHTMLNRKDCLKAVNSITESNIGNAQKLVYI